MNLHFSSKVRDQQSYLLLCRAPNPHPVSRMHFFQDLRLFLGCNMYVDLRRLDRTVSKDLLNAAYVHAFFN